MSVPQPNHATVPIKAAAAGSRDGQESPKHGAMPTALPAALDPRGLIAAVRLWEELQRYRIRVSNAVGAVERAGAAVPIELAAHLSRMAESEKEMGKLIVREWRAHPLAPWAKTVRGLGEHNAAVLVAMLDGDPYVAYPKHWESTSDSRPITAATPEDTRAIVDAEAMNRSPASHAPEQAKAHVRSMRRSPARVLVADDPHVRTVAQLRQFCGVGSPGRRTAGMTQEEALRLGKPLLKSRLRLISESFLKAGNERYRAVYDAEKAKTEGRKHEAACAPCHAKTGDAWRDGHRHSHALRVVAKAFLLDLWVEARRLHEADEWR